MTVDELNALPEADAAELFRAACGAHRWASTMATQRPFRSVDHLLAAADDAWAAMREPDWREAFDHHPRIGEQQAPVPQNERAATWSAGEQAAASSGSTREEMADVNRDYERRFGHIYIVCATGRSAGELLAIAKHRLNNDPPMELRVAAEEQRKITNLRLHKLVAEST